MKLLLAFNMLHLEEVVKFFYFSIENWDSLNWATSEEAIESGINAVSQSEKSFLFVVRAGFNLHC